MDGTRFYPQVQWSVGGVTAKPTGTVDAALVKRTKAAYEVARTQFGGYGESWWIKFEPKKQDCHQALTAIDDAPAAALMSNPCNTELYWGMDHCLCRSYREMLQTRPDCAAKEISLLCDSILRLAEATGAIRLTYPEGEDDRKAPVDIEATLAAIENRIGAKIDFPNPFADEFGMQTSRGIATFRAVQAIYQAWRLRTLADVFGRKILEIGGGTGRTAYYARRFGLTDYTIIDLPMTSVAQATFLGRTLGPDSIALAGESASRGQVRIETPSWFLKTHERFDIVVNVDSLTEMDQHHAARYARTILGAALRLLVGEPRVQRIPRDRRRTVEKDSARAFALLDAVGLRRRAVPAPQNGHASARRSARTSDIAAPRRPESSQASDEHSEIDRLALNAQFRSAGQGLTRFSRPAVSHYVSAQVVADARHHAGLVSTSNCRNSDGNWAFMTSTVDSSSCSWASTSDRWS